MERSVNERSVNERNEHNESVNEHNESVNEHNESVNEHNESVNEHNESVNEHNESVNEQSERSNESGHSELSKPSTLVLSGGGVRGVAYVGVFKKLQEMDILQNIKTVCGVSIGSIFGLLHIIGYTSDELREELLRTDFMAFKSTSIKHLSSYFGIDSGKGIIKWVEVMMEKKGFPKTINFEQLYKRTGKDLQVLATQLNTYQLVKFTFDSFPKLKVIKAIKMSISLPLIFAATRYNGNIYVDGGIMNNYPIDLFSNSLENVLGIKLAYPGELQTDQVSHDITGLDSFIYHTVTCFYVQRERYITFNEEYKARSIFVSCSEVNDIVAFNVSNEQKLGLMNNGYTCACDYFLRQS